MRDITHLMDHYRVVARSLWNTGFWAVPELRNWDARDSFEKIKQSLFDALITSSLRNNGSSSEIITIVPVDPGPVPIMIQNPRGADQRGYWDDPVDKITPADADLRFLDFFDWNEMADADFQYYRVRIEAFGREPRLAGREALLDHSNARAFAAD
jgi:hypothetical protein